MNYTDCAWKDYNLDFQAGQECCDTCKLNEKSLVFEIFLFSTE